MLTNLLSGLTVNSNFKYLFLHPLMLAFYSWIIIIYFIPNFFERYNTEILSVEYRSNFDKCFYEDIDGDGISERISTGYNSYKTNKDIRIQHFNINDKIFNQWYVKGNWLEYYNVYFDDYDGNGYKEIYFLTIDKDSIYLNVNELMLDNGLRIKNKFVCKAGTYEESLTDIRDAGAAFIDADGDGYDEFIFSLAAGFSKFPRNTFRYNIVDDSILMSPQSASGFCLSLSTMDLNNDGVEEITSSIGSPENIHYEMPYTDSSAWLMVLNPITMKFLFPPIRYQLGIGSQIIPEFNCLKGKNYITVKSRCNSALVNKSSQSLLVYNEKGSLLNERSLNIGRNESLKFINKTEQDDFFYIIANDGDIYKTDLSLELEKVLNLDNDIKNINESYNYTKDVDGDGEIEHFFVGYNNLMESKLLIYRSDFSNCTSVDLKDLSTFVYWHLDIIKNDQNAILMLQADNYVYKIDYHKSPYYIFKYPAYISVYFVLFLLFWLLQKGQNMVAAKAMEEEKKLMKQQIALSKKQLEPHFMLNILNNIGNMFAKEEKEDAQYFFGKFASLLHRGLMYADKTEISLFDELGFVRDYLVLQQRRFEKFSFNIEASEEIDLELILIPHSLIYTFVENALKHGLRDKVGEKKLEIKIAKLTDKVEIIVRDNGIGRRGSKTFNTSGTGKGLGIIENIVNAYNNLNSRKISFKIFDLEGGTEVVMLV